MVRRELEARSQAFGLAVFRLCRGVSTVPEAWGPARQLVDCATSVGANYRATARARSRAEFVAKLGVVVEEADEAAYWLEFMDKTCLGEATARGELLNEARQLRAIFAAAHATARRNRPVPGRKG